MRHTSKLETGPWLVGIFEFFYGFSIARHLTNDSTVYCIYTCVCVKWMTKSLNSRVSCTEEAVAGMCEGAPLRTRLVLRLFQGGHRPSSHGPPAVHARHFGPRPDDRGHISKCLLRLWPQLWGMSLAALCSVIDFIPCVTTNTLLRGTKKRPHWGFPPGLLDQWLMHLMYSSQQFSYSTVLGSGI